MELERTLDALLRTDPERLRRIIGYLLNRYKEHLKEEALAVKLRMRPTRRKEERELVREEYVV